MFLGLEKHDATLLAVRDMRGASLTYGDLRLEIARMWEALPGRALAFCMCKNTVGCALGYLAMVDAGVVPVMLSAAMPGDLLSRLAEEYEPELWWAPVDFVPSGGEVVLYETCGYRLTATGAEPCEMHEMLELCMSTSGSTGDPKLVRYKRGNLEANARNVATVFGWDVRERGLCDLGLQYTMGLNVFNSHLFAGATALLCDANPISSEYWDYLKGERATNLTGVPFTYDILARLRFTCMDLPHLRTIAEGGGKLTDARFRELADYAAENGKRFFATFGTTETAARLAYLPPELARQKTGSIGRALPEGELFLADSNGNVVEGCVAEGELCYRGPNVTMGYARCRADLSLGDGWRGEYRTGDLARRDEDGCYYITGRISRFLKLLGHRVSLDQCERILAEKLGVECACSGTDERMEIYLEDAGKAEDAVGVLASFLQLQTSLFGVIAVGEIPRSESGKVMYDKLAEAHARSKAQCDVRSDTDVLFPERKECS